MMSLRVFTSFFFVTSREKRDALDTGCTRLEIYGIRDIERTIIIVISGEYIYYFAREKDADRFNLDLNCVIARC